MDEIVVFHGRRRGRWSREIPGVRVILKRVQGQVQTWHRSSDLQLFENGVRVGKREERERLPAILSSCRSFSRARGRLRPCSSSRDPPSFRIRTRTFDHFLRNEQIYAVVEGGRWMRIVSL